jgi:hypothetical protein
VITISWLILFSETIAVYSGIVSRPGGVVVSVLATGPKGCRFKPGQGDGFFKGDKNPQHTFLSDGK